ncbi:MAG TPA: heparinase II/III family protein, partial [Verrucomicrobiae bacterium]|nr:heparinase II/III family protein [Verrucomicrobiae bacterium]
SEKYIHSFLSGFAKDGYCYEGIGYWNYGFGHFIVLTEEIRKATKGRVDLFLLPEVQLPAQFGDRDEIVNGIYPSISDVNPGQKPDPQWLRYVNERFQIATKPGLKYKNSVPTGNLAEAVFALFAEKPWPVAKTIAHGNDSPLRTWFNEGGVLIARPGPDEPEPFAVVIKGGSNGESHNHNDVGSFSVVLGRAMIICDPGAEVYTKRTFGTHRYDSDVLNSFGHAVPMVAGQLQATGSSARAVVLRSDFTDAEDVLAFDLRSAYQVPGLKKLERTFDYRRGADAGLRVEDEVVFDSPEQFESALITWGDWQEVATNEFKMTDGGEELRVSVDTGGVPYTIRKTMINADVHTPRKPWHIGIALNRPVKEAKVTLTIRPMLKKD